MTDGNWLQRVVATATVSTILLPFSGALYFYFSHFAIRSMPSELLGQMPILQLAYLGFAPTTLSLLLGAYFYFFGRMSQDIGAAENEMKRRGAEAVDAGLTDENLEGLEHEVEGARASLAQVQEQRAKIVSELAEGSRDQAEIRKDAKQVEELSVAFQETLAALEQRLATMRQAMNRWRTATHDVEDKLDRWTIFRLMKPLERPLMRLNRLPRVVRLLLGGLLLIAPIVVMFLLVPFVLVAGVTALNVATLFLARRQRSHPVPVTAERTVPIVAALVLVTSALWGATAGPTRLADVHFDTGTGLADGTYGYLGTGGLARYFVDCSGQDRVLVVGDDRILRLTLLPLGTDTSPTLLALVQEPARPMLPFIGSACPPAP